MYLHEENKELFRDAILLASQRLEVSEDIDITFSEHLGEARRKKLKYKMLKSIADELGLISTYGLGMFPMRVQSLDRTLIDKIFES